jgi:hypothetical protein
MSQPSGRNPFNLFSVIILTLAIFCGFQLAPLPGGARSAFGQLPDQRSNFPTNPSTPPPSTSPTPIVNSEQPFPMTPKQRARLAKANFHKTQQDADRLVKLAQSLKTELDKSSPNILSVSIVNKAKKIEKLAKKIKSEAVNND